MNFLPIIHVDKNYTKDAEFKMLALQKRYFKLSQDLTEVQKEQYNNEAESLAVFLAKYFKDYMYMNKINVFYKIKKELHTEYSGLYHYKIIFTSKEKELDLFSLKYEEEFNTLSVNIHESNTNLWLQKEVLNLLNEQTSLSSKKKKKINDMALDLKKVIDLLMSSSKKYFKKTIMLFKKEIVYAYKENGTYILSSTYQHRNYYEEAPDTREMITIENTLLMFLLK